MTYSTGNTERDEMLLRAIRTAKACHDPISVESLSNGHLPHDFQLDADELDGMLSTLPPEPPADANRSITGAQMIGHPVVETAEPVEAPAVHDAEHDAPGIVHTEMSSLGEYIEYIIDDGVSPRTVAPKIKESEARRQLDAANQRLTKARDNMAVARGVLKERRTDLASAITQWQLLSETATDGLTKEQRTQRELRAHLEAQNAERAARVQRRNNSAAAYVTKRMSYGPQRGAYSQAARARAGGFNHDPRRGAVQKLPSER